MKDIDKKSLKNIHDQSKPNNHGSSRWKYAEWWKLSWLADMQPNYTTRKMVNYDNDRRYR